MKQIRIFALISFALAALPAQAGPLGILPPPKILITFEKTVAAAKSLSVQVEASEDGAKVDKARLTFVSPNKLRIDSHLDKEREGLISNGKTLKQWDNKYYTVGSSAPTLADLNEIMSFDSLAGDFAEEVFTTPKDFAEVPEFTDLGQRIDNGETVDTLTATNFHGTKILTVDSKTGLPIEYDYIRKHGGFTVRFKNYKIDLPVATYEFAEAAPRHLKVYLAPKNPPLLANGTKAPDFTLSTPNGQKVTLSSYKGQVVLVDFWASWCPPCKMSMPHVQAVYNDLKSQGLNILSVNTWDDAAFAKDFLAKHPWYNTTFLIDPSIKKSVATTKYQVYGIPTLYIIDKTGKIADSYVDYDPNEEKTIRADLAKLGISKD